MFIIIYYYAIRHPIVLAGCVDVALCCQTVSNRFSSCSFSLILTKLGTHDLCANSAKNGGTDLRNFAFNIFGEFFLNFTLRQSLEQ